MAPYDWLNRFYSFYMVAVVVISSGCLLRIEAYCRNQPYKTKPSLYKPLLLLLQWFKTVVHKNKKECFSCRGACGCVWALYAYQGFKRTAGFGYRQTASAY